MNIDRPSATNDNAAEQPSPRSWQQTEHVARNIASDRRRTEIARATETPGDPEKPADGAIETEPSEITVGIESIAKRSRKSPDENQDAAFALSGTETRIQAYGVLDGVSETRGAFGSGREAAQGARELIQGEVLRMPPDARTDASAAIAHLTEAFARVQEQFGRIQEVRPQATTASVMLVIEDPITGKPVEVVIATLGDSPVSRIRGGKLEQLSIPQTGLQVHVEREFKNEPPDILDAAARYARDREDPSGAKLSEKQRASIDGVRFIDRFLGAGFGVENSGAPKIIRERIEPGDLYLLETDGSSKRSNGTERDPEEIVQLASEHPDGAAFAKALAAKADGHDDATVVAVRFGEATGPVSAPDAARQRHLEIPVVGDARRPGPFAEPRPAIPEMPVMRVGDVLPTESPPERTATPEHAAPAVAEPLVDAGHLGSGIVRELQRLSSEDLQTRLRDHRTALRAIEERSGSYPLTGWLAERVTKNTPREGAQAIVEKDARLREEAIAVIDALLFERRAPDIAAKIRRMDADQLSEKVEAYRHEVARWEDLSAQSDANLLTSLGDPTTIDQMRIALQDRPDLQRRFDVATRLLSTAPDQAVGIIQDTIAADRGFKTVGITIMDDMLDRLEGGGDRAEGT